MKRKIGILVVLLLTSLPLLAEESSFSSIPIREEIDQASRELQPLLNELEIIGLYSENEKTKRLESLTLQFASFEAAHAPLRALLEKSPHGKFPEELKSRSREDRLSSPLPITEEGLLEMKLRVQAAKIREMKKSAPLDPLDQKIWEWENRLSEASRAIQEGELLAFYMKLSIERGFIALNRLEKEAAVAVEETKQKEAELQLLLQETIDPDLKRLKIALIKEHLFQLENHLGNLRREARVAATMLTLSTPSPDQGDLSQNLKEERLSLAILREKRGLQLAKQDGYKAIQLKIKAEATLTPQAVPEGMKIGESLELPPGMQEKLALAETLLTLVSGELRRMEQEIQEQNEVAGLLETSLSEKSGSPETFLSDALKKAKEVAQQLIQKIAQAIKNLLK